MRYECEIRALLEKADRSLRASRNLIESGDYDFLISRAYYAMFYCGEAVLLTKYMEFSKNSAVIATFG
ncbi:MAG: HEPN domain-containing protein, partial [Methanotrichaceae archaeon]